MGGEERANRGQGWACGWCAFMLAWGCRADRSLYPCFVLMVARLDCTWWVSDRAASRGPLRQRQRRRQEEV